MDSPWGLQSLLDTDSFLWHLHFLLITFDLHSTCVLQVFCILSALGINSVNRKARYEIFISHLFDTPRGATDAKSLVILKSMYLRGIPGDAWLQEGIWLPHFPSGDKLLWDLDEGMWTGKVPKSLCWPSCKAYASSEMETVCVHLMTELRKHGPRVLWNTAQPNKDLNNCRGYNRDHC